MEQQRFLADAMLGRLARWLRALSFDVTYEAEAPDAELVRRANVEQRVLLTRDRHLLRELRPARWLEVLSDRPIEQVAQAVTALALPAPREMFTRCLLCNVALDDVPRAEREAVVPPSSRGLPGPVRRCPRCGRVYWHGSHARRMRRAVEQALPGWLGDSRAPE